MNFFLPKGETQPAWFNWISQAPTTTVIDTAVPTLRTSEASTTSELVSKWTVTKRLSTLCSYHIHQYLICDD